MTLIARLDVANGSGSHSEPVTVLRGETRQLLLICVLWLIVIVLMVRVLVLTRVARPLCCVFSTSHCERFGRAYSTKFHSLSSLTGERWHHWYQPAYPAGGNGKGGRLLDLRSSRSNPFASD